MERSKGSVLERSEVRSEASVPASTIKSILFHVHDDEELQARVKVASSLARDCSAHLQCLQVIPVGAFTTVDAFGTFISAQAVAMLGEQAAKLRVRVETLLADEGVSWSYDSTSAPLVPEILRHAALSDLLLIGRDFQDQEFGRSARSLLGEIICKSTTPLCIPGTGADRLDPYGTVVIAWNGSVEAANAIRQTIGLIRMASQVRVINIKRKRETAFPETRVLEYLSRHDVHAKLDSRPVRHDVTYDLIEYAAVTGASYIVMGGYSHSRAGEFLFGGVTRELLRGFPISLVMAH